MEIDLLGALLDTNDQFGVKFGVKYPNKNMLSPENEMTLTIVSTGNLMT